MEYAIIFLPLIGSIFGYLGKSIAKFFSEIFTSLLVSISAIFSIVVFWNGIENNNYGNYQIVEWISSGDFVANWSIQVDPLSSVMLVVVTFVSALVHIYSIGYMSHDPHKPRFMSYLSLFTFSMFVLVVSDNFLQLFFGWEGVGLCSYLLIGFWYKKETANNAAIKAFIVNRVGDFGLAVGIFLIFFFFGSINFEEVFQSAPEFVKTKLFTEITTSIFVSLSAILSLIVFWNGIYNNSYGNFKIFEWVSSGNFVANWSINIDPLSSIMLVVVTFISALVHIYSVGYMSHDPHKPRFMSYLSLFTFSMLVLVVSDNFLQLFFGWEGVGLCSYLLIGFWYKKESANNAAIKAFIVNRVGDFGLAIGIFLIFFYFGTINFQEVFNLAPQYVEQKLVFFGFETSLITLICLFLFIGAMGKSAQFLLHTWLPDAMEGPTPVSALIHAATMVTAGVFLVVRCSPLFEYSLTVLNLVTIVGMITAIFAASVALVQTDIKKIVAYSTCSQLGYMFFAAGVGAYHVAMFHLFTHAFFKA